MKEKHLVLFVLIVALTCFSACHRKERVPTPPTPTEQKGKVKNTELTIIRYEQLLFALDRNQLAAGMESLYGKVPEVLVAKDCWKNSDMISALKGYLNDRTIQDLYQETQKQYPDLDDVSAKLKSAFKIYLTHFPEDSIPEIVTMISGLDFSRPSVWGLDNTLFVNLDMYLGKDYKYYASAGMPKFISARCERKFLPTDCFTKVMVYRHLPDKTAVTALDQMLAEGKKLFLTQVMFPSVPECDIIGYSTEKFDWAVQHEGAVWQYLIEKNMIYSKDENVMRQLVGETPFTRVFCNNSPGRLGAYIGWRIIQSYMKEHPETSLQDLMQRTDSQKLLSESFYKPSLRK